MTYSRAKKNEIKSLIKSLSEARNKENILNFPIDKIDLSIRATNVLLEKGIQKISDFLLVDLKKLYTAKNMGIKTVYEIRNVINKLLLACTDNRQTESINLQQNPTQSKINDTESFSQRINLKGEAYELWKRLGGLRTSDGKLWKMYFRSSMIKQGYSSTKEYFISMYVKWKLNPTEFIKNHPREGKYFNNRLPLIKRDSKELPLDVATKLDDSDKISFIDALESILGFLKPRSLYVIKARFGYEDRRRRTLEEIGALVGITRERVRQILAKEIKRFKHPIRRRIFQSLLEPIEGLLHRYKGIISINDIAKDEYFVSGNRKQLRFLMNLIAELYEERYSIIDRYFLTSLDNNEIKALQSQIREAAFNCQFPIDEEVFLKNIMSSIGLISKDYLIYHLIYREHIEISKGKVLSLGRLTVPQRVKLLMTDIKRPMHFTEIARIYRNHFGDVKIRASNLEHAIHARVGDSTDFIIVNPGTFMRRDSFKTPDNIEEIAEMSKEILRSLQSISDTRYLINELTKRNIDVGNLNAYSLKTILLEYPGFVSYRKFEIGIEDLTDKYERKPLGDLVYEILLSATKSMNAKAIWEQILKQRGFPRYAIDQRLAEDSRFIKVAPATYTVAKNIAQYEEKQKIIIDFAKEWINLKRNAISAFFISEVLKETAEIKDLSLGLVEHVLATSPEFIRLPNGFYDLAHKENNLK